MTVKELIEALGAQPQDAPVCHLGVLGGLDEIATVAEARSDDDETRAALGDVFVVLE